MPALIVGFAGPAGVGKTTAAHLLGAEWGVPAMAFADPIREAVLALVPHWDLWHLNAGKDKVDPCTGFSPRHAMRSIGDHATGLQADIYIRDLDRRVFAALIRGVPGVLIHDVRRPAEADWLRGVGGTLIHLRREGVEFRLDHATEVGIVRAPGDLGILNPGNLERFRAELLGALVAVRTWMMI